MEITEPFSISSHQDVITVCAFFVGERIEFKSLGNLQKLAQSPLVVRAGEKGCAVLFRYGAVVFFELDATEQTQFLENLRDSVTEPYQKAEHETAEIKLRKSEDTHEGVSNDTIYVKDINIERIQIIADIFAKSTVLDFYERQVAAAFDSIEPLVASLQHNKRQVYTGAKLQKYIGQILFIHHKMVGRAEISEKPDVLWDHPELERLYARLQDEYELRERHLALERKLKLISYTVETILDLLNTRRSLRVEWYIVILILVEIVLMSYELLIGA